MRATDAACNAAVALLAPGASILGAPHSIEHSYRLIGLGKGKQSFDKRKTDKNRLEP